MQRMQRRGGGGGDPGGVRPGARMSDLLHQHIRHPVRRRPHALADLRAAAQPALQTDIDVLILIRLDPGGVAHLVLADHRPRFHRGVHLVARAIQEAGVDEYHPVLRGMDAGLQIAGGPPFLIHDAHFQGVASQAQDVLDASEQGVRERHLLRPMHLRLHNINTTRSAVLDMSLAIQVVHRDQGGNGRVQKSFRDFPPGRIQHRIRVHMMPDIADQHDAASGQPKRSARRLGVLPIGVQLAGHHPPGFFERVLQGAIHQAKPVAVGEHLVVRIDGCDGVLAILDRRQRRFQHQIGHAGGIVLADRVRAVDDDLDVQAVVLQQDRRWRIRGASIADTLGGIAQTGLVAAQGHDQCAAFQSVEGGIGVAAGGEGRGLIQDRAGAGDHPVAADLVETTSAGRAVVFRDRVRAIQGVVKAAPARIGGVQGVACIGHRHDELRSGHGGDFRIDLGGAHAKIGGFGLQVADAAQKGQVVALVDGLAAIGQVPCVDLLLQRGPLIHQRLAARGKVAEHGGETLPEGGGGEAGAGKRLIIDEIEQSAGDA